MNVIKKRRGWRKNWEALSTCCLLILVIKMSFSVKNLTDSSVSLHYVDFKSVQFENRSNEEIIQRPFFHQLNMNINNKHVKEQFPAQNIPLVIVLCQKVTNGSRNNETIENKLENSKFFRQTKVLLKSIALATDRVTRVIIVVNTITVIEGVVKYVGTWPVEYRSKLLLEYKTFKPRKECMDEKLFVLCASVRLFLHEILPDEEAVIYIDSDFIFLESPHKLATHFQEFDHLQFLGAVHNGGFYEFSSFFHYADYYYYGNTGITSGLLLMNLTRIRNFQHDWTETVYGVCRSYKRRLKLYDQGVYNIILSEFPEYLYELDCRWGFNVYYCHERSVCYETLKYGNVFAVHGPSNTFFQHKSKKLKVIFKVFEKFVIGDSISELISTLNVKLKEIERIQPEDSDGCKNFTVLDKALIYHLIQHIEI